MKYDLEYVLDSALDGIFIVACDHRLVLFNRACEELYRLSKEDIVDKASRKLQDLKKILQEKKFEKGKPAYGELASEKERMVLPHKGNKEVWVETIYTPIYDQDNGEIAYVMGVIKDITEQKNLEIQKQVLLTQLSILRKDIESKYDFSNIIGQSSGILNALELAGEVAKQNTTVFLSGESGTGKELFAKAIHYNSRRASKPFIAINCSGFPDTLIESELFGYEKGAFTGAEKTKPGKIQLVAGGTLFLDEVTDMSLSAQAKMLRIIQEREFEMLGGIKTLRADIRIIASTNTDIQKRIREGKFREDLYYRLYVYPIFIPPLRDRLDDLEILAKTFISQMNREMGKQVQGLTPEAWKILKGFSWPGNIRELQNVIERLLILSKNPIIGVNEIPGYIKSAHEIKVSSRRLDPGGALPDRLSLDKCVRQFETNLIVDALKESGFNKTKAAGILGLTRSTFRYKLAKVPHERLKTGWDVNN
ncbi:MAG: sigma 54-interacting transcriptional regulator [Nitrospinae bacterium]|nr:sigma 54-interacting transcriptional regulator [Nitrospinota bacterium]